MQTSDEQKIFEELIYAVKFIAQCGGRCPHCMENILPEHQEFYAAS